MEEVVNFFSQIIVDPNYPKWLYWCTITGIIILTQLIKLPIKHFTDKITVENTRKRVNIVIMFIPLILGVVASYLLTFVHYPFSEEAGVRMGTASIVIYGLLSRLFARIKNGEEITTETIKEDTAEAVKEAEEIKQDFEEKVEQIQNTSASETFDNLVDKIKNGN